MRLNQWLRSLRQPNNTARVSARRRRKRAAIFESLEDRRMLASVTTLVNSSSLGVLGNAESSDPAVSANGRYVAFASSASNLVTGDTNSVGDIFVKDLVTGITTRASTNSSGTQGNGTSSMPSISADGRFVGFVSGASNLVIGDTNGSYDVFVKDLVTGTTTRVNTSPSGVQDNGGNVLRASISADGKFVAFNSSGTVFVPGDQIATFDVFVKNLVTGAVSRVNTSSSGVVSNVGALYSSISANGQHVVFTSGATNLVAGDTNNADDVFVKDTLTGTTARVSVSSSGGQATSGAGATRFSISADGRYVVFETDSVLVTGDFNFRHDVFVRDTQDETTILVSTSSANIQGNSSSGGATISADGQFVAFTSFATNLVVGDTLGYDDIFQKDLTTGLTTRVSTGANGTQANSSSGNSAISGDGRYVAFRSLASNLVPGDNNSRQDIFIVGPPFNSPPIARPGGPYSTAESTPITLDASASTDAEQATATLSFAWDLNYNGVTFDVDTTGRNPSVSFPDNFSARTIALRVTDSQGAFHIATTTLAVTNVAPIAAIIGVPDSAKEGDLISLGSTVSDPGALDTHTYAWSITKNSVPYLTGTQQTLDWTPDDNGTYAITLTVTDKDGSSGSTTQSMIASNVAPAILSVVNSGPVLAGDNVTVTISATDVAGDTLNFEIDFDNDGIYEVLTTGTRVGNVVTATAQRSFAANNIYPVPIRVTDDDGVSAAGFTAIEVGTGTSLSPVVNFTIADQSITEDGGVVTVRAILAEALPDAYAYVPLIITGTASAGVDYTLSQSYLLFAPGTLEADLTIAINDDMLDEDLETLSLSFGTAVNATLGTVTSHTISIDDNDASPFVSFTSRTQYAPENVGTVLVSAQLSQVSGKQVVIPIVLSGTATAPSDYVAPAAQIIIPAGRLRGEFPLTIVDDVVSESTEFIQMVFGAPVNVQVSASPGAATTHIVTIPANDAIELSFVGSSRSTVEGGVVAITVAMRGISTGPVSVPILISDFNTANILDDYTLSTTTLNFPTGVLNPTATFNVVTINDSLSEPKETVYLRLGTPQGAVLGSGQTFALNIDDNDRSVVEFGDASRVITTSSVFESVANAAITLRLSNPSSSAIDVTLRRSGGSATPIRDFGPVPTTVRFEPGETVTTLFVPIVDDSINEINRTIQFEIVNAQGADIGTARSHSLTINDNDPLVGIVGNSRAFNDAYKRYKDDYSKVYIANLRRLFGPKLPYPELSTYVQGIENQPVVVEGNFTTVEVALSAVTDHPVMLTLKPTGTATSSDYSLSAVSPATLSNTGVLTIPAGAEGATVRVTALEDLVVEASETISVTIQMPVGAELWQGYSSRQVTVYDNTPVVRFSQSAQAVSEGDGTASVKVDIGVAVAHDVYLTLELGGSARSVTKRFFYTRDYVPPSTSVVIPAGSTSATIPISIINDTNRESDETITLKIKSVSGAVLGTPSVYTLTIRDNDEPASAVTSGGVNTIQVSQVAIQTASQPINESASQPTNGSTITVAAASGTGKLPPTAVGTLPFGVYDGYLVNSTVFFDANRNGVLDFVDFNGDGLQDEDEPNEPSSMTSADGAALLTVDETFDVDGNGIINEFDGMIVTVGGLDSSTGFPLAFPLTGYFNTPGISPLTTLLTGLVEEYDFDVSTAAQRVANALNLPTVDFVAMDPLAGVLAYNPDAPLVFKTAAMMHNTFTQLAATVSGAAGAPPLYVIAQAAISEMASRITDEGSTLDLQSRAVVDGLLRGMMVRVGVTLPENMLSGAAEVIAAANQLTAEVAIENSDSFLTQIVQSQVVAQGAVASALTATASGMTPVSQLVSENTGIALQNQAANATVGVIIPPGLAISDLSIFEGNTGTSQLVFTVAISEAPQTTVTVDFATDDMTATAEDGDYVPTSGTLTWLAGDAEPKTITVTTNGDPRYEATELLAVILSNVTGAVLRKDIGFGGLINDEALSIDAPPGPDLNGTGLQETILRLNGGLFELITGGESIITQPATSPTQITINGTDTADDSLLIDALAGNPIPAEGIVFHGGVGGNNSVTIRGGDYDQIIQRLTNAADGTTVITLAGADATQTIQWYGLEAFLINAGSVEDLIFELPAGVTSAILEDVDPSDATQPGMMQLRSPDGHFETTIFTNPFGSITIRGGSGADIVTIGTLDPGFTGTILVDAVALGSDHVDVIHSDWNSTGNETINGVLYEVLSKGIAPNAVQLKIPFNTTPISNAGGSYTGPEGSPLILNATLSSDAETANSQLQFEWDLDYDGITFDVNTTGEQPAVTFPDNFATRNIAVRVTDPSGASDIAVTTLTVSNTAPTASFNDSGTITYGDAQSVSFSSQSDISTADMAAGFHYAYSQTGDFTGITYTVGSTTNDSFDYSLLNAGTYTVYARIIDKDNGYSEYSTTFVVDKATATIVVTPYSVTYDGNSHTASGTAVGVLNENLSGLDLSGTTHTNAGTTTDAWTFTDITGNYLDASDTVVNSIAKAASLTTVTIVGGPFTYNGSAQTPATVSVTGAGGLSLTPTASYANNTNAGTATASYIYAGDANHLASDDSRDFDIAKASAVIVVIPYSVTYDGNSHTASGTAVGVLNENLSGLDLSGTTHTNAGTTTDAWTFTDATGNYNDASDTVVNSIAKAASLTTVTIAGGPFTYNGSAQTPATVSVTGAGGLSLTPTANYANNTNAGTATASYIYAGDANHLASDDSQDFDIAKANAAVNVSGYTGSYDAAAHGATGSVVGVAADPSAAGSSLDLGASFTNAPGGTANWIFTGGTNYNDQIGTAAITIDKANAVVTVDGYTGIYDAAAHGATGSAVGVTGDLSAAGSSLNLGGSFTDAPGGTANWVFSGGTNYNDQNGTAAIVIGKANAAVVVNGYTGIYDAAAHGATGSAVGVTGDLSAVGSSLDLGGSFTNAPGGTATWTFLGGINYHDQSGTADIVINKADAIVTVNGYSGTYDAASHGATGYVEGVDAAFAALGSSLDLGDSFTDAPGGVANWSFSGGTNYNDQNGSVAISIARALLTGDAVTQDALNMAKQGNLTITISNLSGLTSGDTLANFLNTAEYYLTVGNNRYVFVPTTVTTSGNRITVSYSLKNSALASSLAAELADNTSGATAVTAGFSMTSLNYLFIDDYLTRLFSTAK